jgi:hypothetical protein
MGYDCAATLTIDGRSFGGRALLEQKDLLFRGDIRLRIPLSLVEEVHAREGDLFITFGGRRASFKVGADAGKWARRISHPRSRAEKLGIKGGMRVGLIGLDDEALVDDIEANGASVAGAGSTGLDLIFLAANAPRDLERLATLPGRIKPAGAVWVVRGKGRGASVSEAESMAAGKRAGLVDVKVVSYSETHSAEKYVIPIAKRGKDPAGARARRGPAAAGGK